MLLLHLKEENNFNIGWIEVNQGTFDMRWPQVAHFTWIQPWRLYVFVDIKTKLALIQHKI